MEPGDEKKPIFFYSAIVMSKAKGTCGTNIWKQDIIQY